MQTATDMSAMTVKGIEHAQAAQTTSAMPASTLINSATCKEKSDGMFKLEVKRKMLILITGPFAIEWASLASRLYYSPLLGEAMCSAEWLRPVTPNIWNTVWRLPEKR